ncbi:hypothetical protein SDJN03_12651, partial [Cucurbita argyrosperma subsp. sororia]
MGIEPGISGFVDQRLIHWAMESYDREAWAADSIPEAWAEGLIHLSIFKRKTIDKNDSTGDRTQSLWFRRPAPYPLGHGVVRPPAPYPSGHGVDRKAWAADQRLIHWAMESYDSKAWAALQFLCPFSKRKVIDKDDSSEDRTQSHWFRRPASYPLGYEVVRP